METLNAFINADPDRDFLKTWISWWNDRRGFIFCAFAPTTNAPRMNQAEVIHAGWAHRDQPKLSLLDVCQADTRDSLLLELELQSLHAGSAIKGKCPSFMDHKRERYQSEIDRAKKMGKEMFDGRKVDPKSTHRPPAEKKTQSQKNKESGPTKEARSKWFYYRCGTTTHYICGCHNTQADGPYAEADATADTTADATADTTAHTAAAATNTTADSISEAAPDSSAPDSATDAAAEAATYSAADSSSIHRPTAILTAMAVGYVPKRLRVCTNALEC